MFLIKKIYKFLKKIAKSFGYELNVEKTTFTFLNIYKSYQEAISSSKNNDNYITKEYQKKTNNVYDLCSCSGLKNIPFASR